MNLENRTLESLEFNIIVNWIENKCNSIGGKEYAINYKPNQTKDSINLNLNYSNEILQSIYRKEQIIQINLSDINPILKMLTIKNSILEINYFRDLYLLIKYSEVVKNRCTRNFLNWKKNLKILNTFKNEKKHIEKIFDDNFKIKNNASNELLKIRNKILLIKSTIHNQLQKIFSTAKKNNWNQGDELVWIDDKLMIPLQVTYKRKITGVIHSFSTTGQTAFIEPIEIIKKNNELQELYIKENIQTNKILSQLTAIFRPFIKQLKKNDILLSQFDYHTACAIFAYKYKCIKPELNNSNINISQGRNPLLLISNKKIVPLNCNLNQHRMLIISGPNAGGKTVVLKTIGLFSLMIKNGIFIPAKKIELPNFKYILCDIGDQQSIENDLSTFSAHIQNITNITNIADSTTLVLLDELGTGTDPSAGTAIAKAILDFLLKTDCFSIITTHIGAIKNWGQNNNQVINSGMQFDSNSLQPTFKIKMGYPGSSFAIEISERLGLKNEIINNAKSNINSKLYYSDSLIEELMKKNEQSDELLSDNKKRKEKLILYEKELQKEKEEVHSILKNIKRNFAIETKQILSTTRKEVENLVYEIKKNNASKSSIINTKKYISNQMDEVNKTLKETKPNNNNYIDINKIKIGCSVTIPDIGNDGEIISLPDKKGNITIDINNKRINLPIEKIIINNQDDQSKLISHTSTVSKPESYIIDLRGKNVNEATNKTLIFLDQSMLAGLDFVHIIHGKGTGALQKSIRDELKNISYIKSFNFADVNNGGTGVTIVEFKK